MAIARDAAVDGGLGIGVTSLTWAHTCAGSDRVLFVTAFGDVNNDVITGATYAGVTMTLVDKLVAGTDRYVYQFVLFGPAPGSNNAVVSASSPIAIAAHSVSYTGAQQSGPDSHNTGTETSNTTLTVATNVVASNCWLFGSFRDEVGTGVPGAGTTELVDAANGLYSCDSNGTVATGSQSLQYTNVAIIAAIVTSFAPVIAPVVGAKILIRNRAYV